MSQNLQICAIDDDLIEKLKKLRFRKKPSNMAIIMKIDVEKQIIIADPSVDDDETEDKSPEEIAELLPSHQPRYVALSYCYKHDDGRTSYPLCFIFITPAGCKTELQMMYAGSKTALVQKSGFTKVFELRDTEDMTEEWLKQKLGFFR